MIGLGQIQGERVFYKALSLCLMLSLTTPAWASRPAAKWAKAESSPPKEQGKLPAPFGLAWRMPLSEAKAKMESSGFTYVTGELPIMADSFVNEVRFSGQALGEDAEHVALLFFAGELTAVTLSFATTSLKPASRIWENIVAKLEGELGPPLSKTKPMELLSIHAVLDVLPEETDKSKILSIYKSIARDGELARFVIKDLQIQVKDWIPEAVWQFSGGTRIKVFVRTGPMNEYGLKILKPAVTYAPLAR